MRELHLTVPPGMDRNDAIRSLAFEQGVPQADIARFYSLSESTVSTILNATSLRKRVEAHLEANPRTQFTTTQLAQELHEDPKRVNYVVGLLDRRGQLAAGLKSVKGMGQAGNHEQLTGIQIRKDRSRPTTLQVVRSEPTEVQAPPPVVAEPLAPVYPLLVALQQRTRVLSEAAALLESAGLDDLALAALSKVDELTPLEREYLQFASRCDQEHETPT